MDEKENQTPQEPQKEPVKYATPMQRLWAWVGVVYMVILTLLTTYALSHAQYLRGIGPLMLSPALCGLGGAAILLYRQGKGRGGLPACILVAGGCFMMALLGLVRSIPAILGQL